MSYDLFNDLFYYLKMNDAELRNRGFALQYGQLIGGATLDPAGRYDAALRANAAASDYGEWEVRYGYVPKESVSVAAWVYLDVLPSSMFGAYPKTILSYSNQGADYGVFLGSLSGDDISFRVIDEATSPYTASYTETVTGQWIHYVGISDPDNVYLYRNGVLVDSAARSGDIGRLVGGTLKVGQNWQGMVDEAAWWGRLLSTSSPDEVTEAQDEYPAPVPDNLALDYAQSGFDLQYALVPDTRQTPNPEPESPRVIVSFDGYGNAADVDAFPNNAIGTLADGSRDAINHGADLIEGLVRQAVEFDGASYIDTQFSAPLDGAVSVALWVNIPSTQAGVSFALVGSDTEWEVRHNAGTVVFSAWGASSSYTMSAPADYDRWLHIAAVADDVTGNVTLHVDGVAQAAGIGSVGAGSSDALFIGAANDGGAPASLGIFAADEFRAYLQALTEADARLLAQADNIPSYYFLALPFAAMLDSLALDYVQPDVGAPYLVSLSPTDPNPVAVSIDTHANKTFTAEATVDANSFTSALTYWEVECSTGGPYLYYQRTYPTDISAGLTVSDVLAVPEGFDLNGTQIRFVVEAGDNRTQVYQSNWLALGSDSEDGADPNLDNTGGGATIQPLPPGRFIPDPLRPTRELPGPSVLRRRERDFS